MARRVAGMWLLGVGCSGGPGSQEPLDTSEPSADTGTVEVGPDTDGPPAPDFTPDPFTAEEVEAVEAALEQFAQELSALDFEPVRAALLAHAQEAEPGCPAWSAFPLGVLWREDCTTSANTRFYGNLAHITEGWQEHADTVIRDEVLAPWGGAVDPGFVLPDTIEVVSHEAYLSTCSVEKPNTVIAMSGFYEDLHFAAGEVVVEQLRLDGEVIDPLQTEGWAARGIVPNVQRTHVLGPGGARVVLAHGSLDRLPDPVGLGLDTVWATDLSFGDAASGDACPDEPSGILSVREADGAWVDVLFDGDDAPGACDGCGRLVQAGVEVGTACADLSSLLPTTGESP